MKLEPGEHTLMATFAHGQNAEEALAALKQAGYSDMEMDRVSPYGFRPDVEEKRPAIHGDETSLVNAVLGPALMDDETRVLMGATPEASGMSGPYTADGQNFLITLVTSNDRVQDAVSILQQHGGRV
jgi:hypothetical protein